MRDTPQMQAKADQIHARETETLRALVAIYRVLVERHGSAGGHARFLTMLRANTTHDSTTAMVGALLYVIEERGGQLS